MALKLAVLGSAYTDDARQVARAVPSNQFAGISFNVYGSTLDLTTLSRSGYRELLRVLRPFDLASLRLSIGSAGFGTGADVDRAIHRVEQAILAATALGSPPVCIDLGRLPPPINRPAAKPAITPALAGKLILPPTLEIAPSTEASPPVEPTPAEQAARGQVQSALAIVSTMADRHGVRLAFHSSLSSLAATVEAIRAIHCPWFGYDLDTGGLLHDRWSIDEALSAIASHLFHVRLRDAVVGDDSRSSPAVIGQGDTDWPVLLATLLEEAAYQGWLMVDPTDLPNRPAAATAGAAYLHAVDSEPRTRNNSWR